MYSVKLDEQGYFTGTYGKVLGNINPIPGGVYVETLPENNNSTCYKLEKEVEIFTSIDENGEEVTTEIELDSLVWVLDQNKALEKEEESFIQNLRAEREEAFVLIDFYQMILVYSELTAEQKSELAQFRLDWLDAPETRVKPSTPQWMIEKFRK